RVAWSLVETRRYEIAGTFPSGRVTSRVLLVTLARERRAPRSMPCGRSRSVMVVTCLSGSHPPRKRGRVRAPRGCHDTDGRGPPNRDGFGQQRVSRERPGGRAYAIDSTVRWSTAPGAG